MIFSETNTEISPALVKAWGELENPKHNTSVKVRMKSGGSYQFEYTDLNGIFNEARRVFKEHGISIIQNSFTSIVDGARVASVETMFLHVSGEYVKSNPLQFNAANSMQDFGGQLTYMKRYSLAAMLGIATEKDDDANGASGNEVTFKSQGNKASDKQLSFVSKLVRDRTPDKAGQLQVFNVMRESLKLNEDMQTWTSQQASQAIKYLQGE